MDRQHSQNQLYLYLVHTDRDAALFENIIFFNCDTAFKNVIIHGPTFHLVFILPSQVCVLQRASSVCRPMQMSPPLLGVGLVHVRVRWQCPPPQGTEHCDHDDQHAQAPFTAQTEHAQTNTTYKDKHKTIRQAGRRNHPSIR